VSVTYDEWLAKTNALANRIRGGLVPEARCEFLLKLDAFYRDLMETVERKNHDYATGEDPYANFRMASLVGVDPRRAVLVRMSDKLARIANCLDKPCAVTDESVVDTLKDLAAYAGILAVWLQEDAE